MNEPKKILLQTAAALDLPSELLSGVPLVTIEANHRVSVENHAGLCSYSAELVEVNTALGLLTVEGEKLEIRTMNRTQLVLEGKLRAVRYQEAAYAENH